MRADNRFLMNITHDELVDYIKENTLTVLGEEIHLHAGAIKGTWDALFPDLMGTDAQGRTVIVEVQTNLDDDSTGIPAAIHKSVGQIIHYAAEYVHKNLRTFYCGSHGWSPNGTPLPIFKRAWHQSPTCFNPPTVCKVFYSQVTRPLYTDESRCIGRRGIGEHHEIIGR